MPTDDDSIKNILSTVRFPTNATSWTHMSNELENFLYETTVIVYTINTEMFIAIEIVLCIFYSDSVFSRNYNFEFFIAVNISAKLELKWNETPHMSIKRWFATTTH